MHLRRSWLLFRFWLCRLLVPEAFARLHELEDYIESCLTSSCEGNEKRLENAHTGFSLRHSKDVNAAFYAGELTVIRLIRLLFRDLGRR